MQVQKNIIDIFGFDCGWGCRDYGCEDGPAAIAMDQILATLASEGLDATWHGTLGVKNLGKHQDTDTKEDTLPFLKTALDRLARKTYDSVKKRHLPIVLGGDHSSAMATWAGVISAQKSWENFGLIWLDAHLDCHTYKTSHQGKHGGWWHGQPIPSLAGFGLAQLKTLINDKTKLNPKHICIIGPTSFEPAEITFTQKHGIHVYDLKTVHKRGFENVFQEALSIVTDGTEGFGISVDLDGFHPDESPGVGTREKDGLLSQNVLPAIRGIARHPKFSALEIVEYNPHKDINRKTATLLHKIITNLFSEY